MKFETGDDAGYTLEIAKAYVVVLVDMTDYLEFGAQDADFCPSVRFVADRLSDLIHAARKAVDGEGA